MKKFVIAAVFYLFSLQNVNSAILVEGNQRIDTQTVISYAEIDGSKNISSAKIDNAIKSLYNTDLFQDVAVIQQNADIIIKVKENPLINQVAFEGNRKIKDDTLLTEIELKSKTVFTKSKLQSDLRRINNLYKRNGRFGSEIVPKVIELDQNRINLVYEINEGEKTLVRKINFIGNKQFTSADLASAIQTKQARWYKILSTNDRYDPEKLQFDQELLRKLYNSKGYADFSVISATGELSEENNAFYVTFILNEGEKYNFGKIDIISEIKSIDANNLKKLLLTNQGDIYNADQIDRSIEKMTKNLGDLGYAFIDIEPKLNQNNQEKIIDITYIIKPAPKVYIDKINITGNSRTLDKVIRRQMRLAEGDAYNASKIRRSQQRLKNLNFFENVDIKTVKKSDNKVDIDVNVAEKSTGELNFGAGFSTADGVIGTASIRERNLMGRGQDLKLSIQKATRSSGVELSFTEPYFMNHDLSAGFDIYSTTRDNYQRTAYDSEYRGVNLRLAYEVNEYINHSLRYTIRRDEVTNISPDASIYIKEQEGSKIVSMIGHIITLDKRDEKLDPKSGYVISLGQDIAGLGGNSSFFRNEIKSAYYHPLLKEKLIFRLSGNTGYITSFDDENVDIDERYFIGGNNLRGFDFAGIGPRDQKTLDALGGNVYYTVSPELFFPLGLPEELGIKGSIFSDIGGLWATKDFGPGVFDNNSTRISVGFGVSWASPVGPIKIDFAEPVAKESYDETQLVQFSFGTKF